MASTGLPVSLADIEAAAGRIAGVAVRTPLLRLPLDEIAWVEITEVEWRG